MTDRISFELQPCPEISEDYPDCESRENYCDGNIAAYIKCNGDNRCYDTDTALELVSAGRLGWVTRLQLLD